VVESRLSTDTNILTDHYDQDDASMLNLSIKKNYTYFENARYLLANDIGEQHSFSNENSTENVSADSMNTIVADNVFLDTGPQEANDAQDLEIVRHPDAKPCLASWKYQRKFQATARPISGRLRKRNGM
jgi:hypothetical protein